MARTRYDETVERGAAEVERLVGDVRYASRDEALELADRLTDGQLVCRLRHHRFTIPRVAVDNTRYKFIYTELACEGLCGVYLCEEQDYNGHVYYSRPNYSEAKGYLSKTGRIAGEGKEAMRSAYVKRIIRPTKTRANTAPRREMS